MRGWREKTASRGRRTKTTVRPSVRSIGRADGLPPPPPVPPGRAVDDTRQPANEPVNAESPRGRMHAAVCKLPLPPVLRGRSIGPADDVSPARR